MSARAKRAGRVARGGLSADNRPDAAAPRPAGRRPSLSPRPRLSPDDRTPAPGRARDGIRGGPRSIARDHAGRPGASPAPIPSRTAPPLSPDNAAAHPAIARARLSPPDLAPRARGRASTPNAPQAAAATAGAPASAAGIWLSADDRTPAPGRARDGIRGGTRSITRDHAGRPGASPAPIPSRTAPPLSPDNAAAHPAIARARLSPPDLAPRARGRASTPNAPQAAAATAGAPASAAGIWLSADDRTPAPGRARDGIRGGTRSITRDRAGRPGASPAPLPSRTAPPLSADNAGRAPDRPAGRGASENRKTAHSGAGR